MNQTLKISLQRLRQIIAVHLNLFSLSALVSLIFLSLLSWANPKQLLGFNLPEFNNVGAASLIAIFFLVPVLILTTSFVSERIRGMSEVRIDSTAAKRSVFVLSGCLWISVGTLIALKVGIQEPFNLTKIVASILSVVSWYYLCRIAITYVKG